MIQLKHVSNFLTNTSFIFQYINDLARQLSEYRNLLCKPDSNKFSSWIHGERTELTEES